LVKKKLILILKEFLQLNKKVFENIENML